MQDALPFDRAAPSPWESAKRFFCIPRTRRRSYRAAASRQAPRVFYPLDRVTVLIRPRRDVFRREAKSPLSPGLTGSSSFGPSPHDKTSTSCFLRAKAFFSFLGDLPAPQVDNAPSFSTRVAPSPLRVQLPPASRNEDITFSKIKAIPPCPRTE